MIRSHGAHKSVTGKGYFVLGYKVGPKDLAVIRELLPCWRRSKLSRLVKLSPLNFEDRVKRKVDPPAFLYFRLGRYHLVFGTPATPEEIEREYPGGIDKQEHAIRLAI